MPSVHQARVMWCHFLLSYNEHTMRRTVSGVQVNEVDGGAHSGTRRPNHFTFPSAAFESSVFFVFLPTFRAVCLSYFCLSTVVIICVSLMTKDSENLYICIACSQIFFCEGPDQVVCPFFKLGCCLFIVNFQEFSTCSGYKPFVTYMCCQYFFQSVAYLNDVFDEHFLNTGL